MGGPRASYSPLNNAHSDLEGGWEGRLLGPTEGEPFAGGTIKI